MFSPRPKPNKTHPMVIKDEDACSIVITWLELNSL